MVEVIAAARPDVLLLTDLDYDHGGEALDALAGRLAEAGADYPHRFAARPNTGMATGLDLDGDGRRGGPGDAQGFGAFAGQSGMALLSRWPIDVAGLRDHSDLLWADLPGAQLPDDGPGALSPEARAVQRLSGTGHWEVPVTLPSGGRLTLMAWYATPPTFGPGRRNALRNRDETLFWVARLDGRLGAPPTAPFVLLGDSNLDPWDGDGLGEAMRELLAHPALQDPAPESAGASAAAVAQGGPNALHRGPSALDTTDWDETRGPGNLRVDYVLPSRDLEVIASGVVWPMPGEPLHAAVEAASRHRLVWVDLRLPEASATR